MKRLFADVFLILAGLSFFAAPVIAKLFLDVQNQKEPVEPVLYIVGSDPNYPEGLSTDSNIPVQSRPNLIIVTHGWLERTDWPKQMALEIKTKVDSNQWLCGWYDWHQQAMVINPIDAAKYGKEKAGPLLGTKIIELTKDLKHVHLIGHSAGSWVITEAAKIIARQTKASIHLTFLDAYVPSFWEQHELGCINEPNVIYWADHYFIRDITLKVTEYELTNAHNVDVTQADPGVNDHRFPIFWYQATVSGKYSSDSGYEGKKLFNKAKAIDYGFTRSLEAGDKNWQESKKLPVGNAAVKITKPKKTLKLRLKELFKK